MPFFCKNCGSAMSSDGKCSVCGNVVETHNRKNGDKKQDKNDNKTDKLLTALIRILLIVLVASVLTVAVLGTLTWFDVVKIEFIDNAFVSMGLKDKENEKPPRGEETTEANQELTTEAPTEPETVPPTEPATEVETKPEEILPLDADQYFSENTTIHNAFSAAEADNIRSEQEAYENLTSRGFTQFDIMCDYDMGGMKYEEGYVISSTSQNEHPMYHTYYVTASGDTWMIMEINGVVMANPLSYNQYATKICVFSETQTEDGTPTITSYDNTLDKFYVNTPKEEITSVKYLETIDANTLETLDAEAISTL